MLTYCLFFTLISRANKGQSAVSTWNSHSSIRDFLVYKYMRQYDIFIQLLEVDESKLCT